MRSMRHRTLLSLQGRSSIHGPRASADERVWIDAQRPFRKESPPDAWTLVTGKRPSDLGGRGQLELLLFIQEVQ